MKNLNRMLFVVVVAAWPATALAYIGPGAGLSAIGSLLALIGAGLLMVVGFVWYPVKRLRRKFQAQHAAAPAPGKKKQGRKKN